MTQMNISVKQKQTHKYWFVVTKGEGSGEGRTGSFGLADAKHPQMDKQKGPTV